MKQQLSLTELAQQIQSRADRKEDFVHPTGQMHISDDANTITLSSSREDRSFELNNLAHSQIGEWADIPNSYYRKMRTQEPELLKTNIERWFQRHDKPRMLRTLDGEGRAFLSDKYHRMDDDAFAETVLPVISDHPDAEIVSSGIEPERTHIKFVVKGLQRDVRVGDPVQFGIAFSNSEVGRGRLSGSLLIYRLVCLNGAISSENAFGANHVGRRHTTRDLGEIFQLDTVKADGQATLLKLRDFSRSLLTDRYINEVVEKMQSMAQTPIGKPVETVEKLAKAKRLSEGEQTSVLEHLIKGGDLTMWGLHNAVTAAAQDADLTYTRATELETLGGSMISLQRSEYREMANAA